MTPEHLAAVATAALDIPASLGNAVMCALVEVADRYVPDDRGMSETGPDSDAVSETETDSESTYEHIPDSDEDIELARIPTPWVWEQ